MCVRTQQCVKETKLGFRFFQDDGSVLQHWHDQIVLAHEVVLGHEHREPATQMRLGLEIVENLPVMEVGVGEDPVDAPADAPELGHGALLDAHPAGEVFVAVEEAGGAVQSVPGVVNGWTLLGRLVGGAQEDPLLRGRHLGAGLGLALPLQIDG